MGQVISFFTNVQNLLSLGVGVLVFATIVTLLGSFGGGAQLDSRMKAVAVRREELKRRSRQAIATDRAACATVMRASRNGSLSG
jgi:tight adherence protein C